jgi:hypothetical protein
VRLQRALWNAGSVSLACGLAGGLLLGWLLSKGGNGWLAPLPWLIYLTVLLVFSVALSLLWPAPASGATADTDRRSERAAVSGSEG